MTTDIFIKTCKHDRHYHKYCLESITKYCKGFRNTVVVDGEHENGYVYQQVIKLHANEYSDADYILVSDSDTLFNQDVTPQSFMKNGKPIWYMTPFEGLLEHEGLRHWYDIMKNFCLTDPPYEFMRRQPFMFPRYVLEDIQSYCVKTHGRTLKEYPFDIGSFTEWNVLGFYCWLHHRDAFEWINTEDGIDAPLVTQFWSHEPIANNMAQIKQILQ